MKYLGDKDVLEIYFCEFLQLHPIFEISSIKSSSMKFWLHLRRFSIRNSKSQINLNKSIKTIFQTHPTHIFDKSVKNDVE